VTEHPVLCTIRALALVFSNRPDAAEASLQDAERCLADDPMTIEARTVLGRVAVIRAAIARFSGDLERSVALGREAMELLPDNDSTVAERASARAHASLSHLVSGEVGAVEERPMKEAIETFAATGRLIPLLNSINRLGRFQIMQGRLRSAYDTYQAAADAVSSRAGLPEAANSSAHFAGLGDICRQWNDLESAERHLRQAIDLVADGVAVDAHVVTDGYLALARVYRARGMTAAARDTLDEFARVARQRDFFALLVERGTAEGARLALTRQDLVAAVRWAVESDLDETNPRYPREDQHLTLARVLLAQGEGPASDRVADGLALLDRLLTGAEAAGRLNSVIEVLALRALAFQAQRQSAAAVDALVKALLIAEPERYVRVFVDEGPPMAALLATVLTSLGKRPRDEKADVLDAYVRRLLAAFEAPHITAGLRDRPAPGRHQLTPLAADFSEREMAVLRLLASTQSQREIAGLLFISFNTVKTHSKSIFRKLGVGTRADAVARARDLDLIH
jgi:LuxR family maltose regulon positive regulatory protein